MKVGKPCLARAFADFARFQPRNHVPGALRVGAGERLTVVPFHALPQGKGEIGALFAPFPFCCQLRHDGFQTVAGDVLVEQDQIVEQRHEGDDDRRRAFLLNRGAGRRVDMRQRQNAPALLRSGRYGDEQRDGRDGDGASEQWIHGRPPSFAGLSQSGWEAAGDSGTMQAGTLPRQPPCQQTDQRSGPV
jgi:hypothetical protein